MQRLVQLALDLFDPPAPSTPSTPAAPPVAGPSAPGLKPDQPKVQVNQSPNAIEKVANGLSASPASQAIPARPALPAAPLPSLLSPAEFRHPKANREVLLGDAVVAYALQRARRRTIGFTVGADGLSVRAPSWVTLGAVDAALRGKADWILRKLSETRERHERLEGDRIVWAHGAELPYLGEPLRVVLDPGHRFAGKGGALVELEAAGSAVAAAEAVTPTPSAGQGARRALHIGLPHSASPAQIRDAVQAWLMRDAKRHFTERLNHFAPQLGVQWASLRLSSAQTRWGSAKSDGSIRLNWRLLHYRPAIIDYVVVHELAHLRVMDHSPRFWDTVATVVPDYADLRRHLRKEPVPPWE